MHEIEITWGRVLAVWWLIYWRTFIVGILIASVVGFILGFIFGLTGLSRELSSGVQTAIYGGAGALTSLIWSLFVVRAALRKRYSDFELQLVPRGFD